MRRLLLLLTLIASVAAAPALAQPADAAERFAEANEAFAAAVDSLGRDEAEATQRFRVAAGLYASIVDQLGVPSADVLTNAGNARLLAGDLGRAIALYHRALRLDPANASARTNLEVARDRVAAAAAIEPARPIVEATTAWRRALSVEARLTIALVAWAALWLALALRFIKITKVRTGVIAWPAAAVLLAAGVTLAADYAAETSPPIGVVTATQTVARTGPDAVAYEESFTAPLPEGVEFRPVQRRPGWVQARFGDGREAWVSASDVTIVG